MYLAALHHNENALCPQALTQEGQLRFHTKFNKRSKREVAYQVKEAPTYSKQKHVFFNPPIPMTLPPFGDLDLGQQRPCLLPDETRPLTEPMLTYQQ